MLIGYARTSTTDQAAELAVQERSLTAFGAERIFIEQAPLRASCPVRTVCLGFLREYDYLVVTRPGRLARSTTDLLAIIADLDKRGIRVTILSLGGQPFDTGDPNSKLVLTILADVACWEREIVSERQQGGVARARSDGRHKGRPRRINADDVTALVGTMSVTKIARKLNISRSSAYRMLQQAAQKP
jgi:DNA invertase Pin-like site-specific DNA recombinase